MGARTRGRPRTSTCIITTHQWVPLHAGFCTDPLPLSSHSILLKPMQAWSPPLLLLRALNPNILIVNVELPRPFHRAAVKTKRKARVGTCSLTDPAPRQRTVFSRLWLRRCLTPLLRTRQLSLARKDEKTRSSRPRIYWAGDELSKAAGSRSSNGISWPAPRNLLKRELFVCGHCLLPSKLDDWGKKHQMLGDGPVSRELPEAGP